MIFYFVHYFYFALLLSEQFHIIRKWEYLLLFGIDSRILLSTLIIFDEKCESLDTNNSLYELQDIGSQINHSIDD